MKLLFSFKDIALLVSNLQCPGSLNCHNMIISNSTFSTKPGSDVILSKHVLDLDLCIDVVHYSQSDPSISTRPWGKVNMTYDINALDCFHAVITFTNETPIILTIIIQVLVVTTHYMPMTDTRAVVTRVTIVFHAVFTFVLVICHCVCYSQHGRCILMYAL